MGFFDFLKQPDINQGVEQYKTTSGAILLDVRTPEEYAEGHIPGGQNLPLQNIDKAAAIIE
ncbi:MAG: rhodanese-like domain-containing protein, partial [Clostridia bacterium]|nr:rhodanese-like domain-containing protein [Clostridia bacterium]